MRPCVPLPVSKKQLVAAGKLERELKLNSGGSLKARGLVQDQACAQASGSNGNDTPKASASKANVNASEGPGGGAKHSKDGDAWRCEGASTVRADSCPLCDCSTKGAFSLPLLRPGPPNSVSLTAVYSSFFLGPGPKPDLQLSWRYILRGKLKIFRLAKAT